MPLVSLWDASPGHNKNKLFDIHIQNYLHNKKWRDIPAILNTPLTALCQKAGSVLPVRSNIPQGRSKGREPFPLVNLPIKTVGDGVLANARAVDVRSKRNGSHGMYLQKIEECFIGAYPPPASIEYHTLALMSITFLKIIKIFFLTLFSSLGLKNYSAMVYNKLQCTARRL